MAPFVFIMTGSSKVANTTSARTEHSLSDGRTFRPPDQLARITVEAFCVKTHTNQHAFFALCSACLHFTPKN